MWFKPLVLMNHRVRVSLEIIQNIERCHRVETEVTMETNSSRRVSWWRGTHGPVSLRPIYVVAAFPRWPPCPAAHWELLETAGISKCSPPPPPANTTIHQHLHLSPPSKDRCWLVFFRVNVGLNVTVRRRSELSTSQTDWTWTTRRMERRLDTQQSVRF